MHKSVFTYLRSSNDSFDWKDTLLDHKPLLDFPAKTTISDQYQLRIPSDAVTGIQHLLIVSAVNDKVLDSQVNVQNF